MDVIAVEKRDMSVKAKQLRKTGAVPCAVYGGSLPESLSIQMEQRAAVQLLRYKQEGSRAELSLEGKTISVQIKGVTKNFLSNGITHISFEALAKGKRVNSVAHIALINAEMLEGSLEQMMFEVPYSALPVDMIDVVTVDLAGRHIGTTITAGEIPEFQNGKIALQVEADSMVLRISEKNRSADKETEAGGTAG